MPPQGSKQARYHAIVPMCARGEIVLPHASIYSRSAELVSELQFAGVGGRFDDAADCIALGVSTIASMNDAGGPSIVIGHDNWAQELINWTHGRPRAGAIPEEVSGKVLRGASLSDADEWAIIGSTLPPGVLE